MNYKRISLLLICSFMVIVFNINPIAAQEKSSSEHEITTTTKYVYAKQPELSKIIIENKTLMESDYSVPMLSQHSTLLKCVKFILSAIVGGIIYDFAKYLYTYEPDWKAVEIWAEENEVNPSDFIVISKNVVFDNGCWKPEFPANPFCKVAPKAV